MATEAYTAQSAIEQRTTLLEHPLGKKILYLRQNWRQEGLPQNWYDMPGTGFWIEPQMAQLPKKWTTAELSSWLTQKVKPDVQGFTLEYLAKRGVFPIQYDIHKQSDGAYLTAPMYGGVKLLDVIDPKERNGALVDAIQEITTFFADDKTPDGALAVITSVKGKSNIPDPHTGNEIIFPDSQRYLLQKRGDSMVGFTIRTDASLDEEREFIKKLTGVALPATSSPEEYVRTIARIIPTEGTPKTFTDVVRIMEEIHQRPLAFENKKEGSAIPWSEIYTDLMREDLWEFPDQTGNLFQQFQDFAILVDRYKSDDMSRHYLRQLLQEGLVATILDISRYVEGAKQKVASRRITVDSNYKYSSVPAAMPLPSYGNTMKTIKAAGGCSKTREESSGGLDGFVDPMQKIINSLTPRVGLEAEEDYLNDPELCRCGGKEPHFHCPGEGCKAAIIVGKGITECPSCGHGKTC